MKSLQLCYYSYTYFSLEKWEFESGAVHFQNEKGSFSFKCVLLCQDSGYIRYIYWVYKVAHNL